MSSTLFTHVRAEPIKGYDPARMLCAIIRMALAVPDSIDSEYFDEIGQLLYPYACQLKTNQSSGTDDSAWPDALARAESGSEHQAAQTILRNAVQRSTRGINILLHGAAGSGKSALAHHLAHISQARVYAVPQQDGARNELPWGERFARLELAQRHAHDERSCVLVFDEADGALDWFQRSGGAAGKVMSAKERMKRLLGTNPYPVIWVRADTEEMDADCLSQFTFCVAFEPPRAAMRRRIVERYLAPVGVTEAVMSAVARHRQFSVDLVSASAKVAQLAGPDPAARDEAVMCHMNGHAKALQLPAVTGVPEATTRFDTGYLHVDGRFTAAQVVDAVVRNGAGKILMNGPPGTGKTQLGKQIADRLGRELLYLTASNINTKWYGESERNVASLFARCNPAEQVIFLDEAETVLGAREDATHRASETVVAEFLRQLEPFPGVFICATNHARHIDAAMIRRFTFRLEFKPLTLAQRGQLLCELTAHLAKAPMPDACQAALARLDGLTPGDFANVKNRFELLGHAPTLDDWIAELQQEWAAKPHKPAGAGIGFL